MRLLPFRLGPTRLAQPAQQYLPQIFAPLSRPDLVPKEKSRLRNRNYLPGSKSDGFPEFLAEPRDSLPHAIGLAQGGFSVREAAFQCREYIEKNLTSHGAILFRKLPLRKSADFSEFVKHIGYQAMDYKGGIAIRHVVDAKASTYTASDKPKEGTIEMHNEMAYKSTFPMKASIFLIMSRVKVRSRMDPLLDVT